MMPGVDLNAFSWSELARIGGQVLLAFVLALPVALERERATRMTGLRTLPLVAVACCGYILVGTAVMARAAADAAGMPGTVTDNAAAHARLLSGLVAGIGFIGGGAILKSDQRVSGTATAASIFATGIMGASVAYRMYGVAALITLSTLATLLLMNPIERIMGTFHGHRARDRDADE